MSEEEIDELKEFTIDSTDIDEIALGLEVCSKKSNMVIQEFIDTIVQLQQENQELKKQLEERQKNILEEILSEYELKEYENTSVEERKEKYFKETCRCCRFNCENSNGLPDDIGKPIKSEVDYFPAHKGCKNFEWD